MPKALLANVAIRTKFLLLPALAALLMLVLGSIYIIGQQRQIALQEQINNRDVPAMRELSRLFSELSTNHVQFVSLLASSFRGQKNEGRFYAAGRTHIIAVNRSIEELRALQARLPGDTGQGEIAQGLLQSLAEYRNQMGETVLQSSVDLERIANFTLQANKAYDAANSRFLALIDRVQAHIGEEGRALQASLHQAQLQFFGALGATLLLIAVGSLWLSRVFSADLTSLMATLKRLSEGDTTVPDAAESRRDEFGALHRVIQAFRQALLRRDEAEQGLKDQVEARIKISERLRQAVHVSQTGIHDLDHRAGTLYWSAEMREIFGLAAEPAVTLDGYFALTLAEDRGRVRAAFERSNDPQGDGSYHIEHRIVRPDGAVRWVLVRSQTVFEGEGEARHALRSVGAARDITERKQAEVDLTRLNEDLEARVQQRTEQLIAAKNEAERANQAKSEFLSRMSHELRTPLNAILGFGQLIQLQAHEARQAAHVREILNAGRHLLELIDEVLDLARVESGHLTVSPEPVALVPLLEDCLALLRPQAEARGVRLLDASRHCDVHVRADRTRLRQVLLNLLSNAVKYNRVQGTVSVVCVGEADALRIRVCDSGPGLTPEQQARLFVPFERLDAEARNIQGTGIGLALSRRLVELMGGSIGVESTPGQGSAFWVRLPLARPRLAEAPTAAPTDAPAAASAGLVRHDVLCIEDNPANLRLVESIFQARPDIRLLSAIAPGLGLELARTHRPAVILLDVNLPDMDGYAVMECLRENEATRHIPVVAVSANAMPKDIERGKAAGFREYLTKPLNIARLLQVVDAAIAAVKPAPASPPPH